VPVKVFFERGIGASLGGLFLGHIRFAG
jgi:hypothetical protein